MSLCLCRFAAALLVLMCAARVTRAADAQAVLREQAAADKAAIAAQGRIDALADEAHDLAAKYRQAKRDAESLAKYDTQLVTQLESQRAELVSLKQQLAEIAVTEREVQPLLARMLDTLAEFVRLDLPFLPEERAARVTTLRELMARADVTVAEKYRRILEAYQIEMEYGRTLEAYDGLLGEGDAGRSVAFLRVGRVTLLYQTRDGRETGYWDRDQAKWVIDSSWTAAVRDGLKIARRQGAPDLVLAPVPAPKGTR